MEYVSGHRCAMQMGSNLVRSSRRWVALALLMLLALPGLAQADCTTMNVPNAITTPTTNPMASGGTIQIHIGNMCDPVGLNPYPNSDTQSSTSPPSHGSVTVDPHTGVVTYANNGDGATSDSFVVEDDSKEPITINVSIGAATSPISISPGVLPNTASGAPYNVTLTATGGTAPYTWSIISGSLPPLMTVNGSTGVISGTTNTNGNFAFNVEVEDSTGLTATKGYTIASPGPNIQITTNLPDPVLGIPYSQTLQSYPGTPPFTYSRNGAAPFPPGLTLSPAGVFSGTPTTLGTYTFGIDVTDSSVDADNGGNYAGVRSYTLTVQSPPPLTLAPAILPATQVGTAFNVTVSASAGVAPYSYAITSGALPAGLSLNASTGAITGTPSAGGSFNFTITATDSNTTGATTGSHAYTLTVAAPTIIIAPATLPDGTTGTPYSQALSANGGIAPYSYAVTAGSLPAGLALSSAGILSGNPSAAGTSNFAITATDSSTGTGPYSQTQTYTVTIASAAPIAGPVSSTVAYGSGANPITLNLSGGTPTSVAVASPPAHGTALASGTTITYQPDAGYAGPDSFTYTASNSDGTSAPATVSITVSPPTVTLTPATLPAPVLNVPYSQSVSASDGATPYSYAITAGSLPAGLSLDATSGAISGTPTATGAYNFAITATDSSTGSGAPFRAMQSYSRTLSAPTLPISPATLAAAAVGAAASQTVNTTGGPSPHTYAISAGTVPAAAVVAAASQTFTTTGGASPYTYAISAGTLPAGVILTSNGTLSGTPTAGGSFNYTVQSTDANSNTGSQTYTWTVNAPTLAITPATLPNATAEIGRASCRERV